MYRIIRHTFLAFILLLSIYNFSYANNESSQYVIIVGSFSTESNANRYSMEVEKKGLNPLILSMDTKLGRKYRVAAINPTSFSDAKSKLSDVNSKLNINNAWILKLSNVQISKLLKQQVPESKMNLAKNDSLSNLNHNIAHKKSKVAKDTILAKAKNIIQKADIAKNENKSEEELKIDIIVESKENETKKTIQQTEITIDTSAKDLLIDKSKITINTTENEIIDNVTIDKKENEINWVEFKEQYLAAIKIMSSMNYDLINNFIDENGFIAIRSFEGTKIADHYQDFKTLSDIINYYGKSFDKTDLVSNLNKYNLSFAKNESLPQFNCNSRNYDKVGVYFDIVNPYDVGIAEIIDNSELTSIRNKVLNILSSINVGVIRGEYLQIKGMYFSYYDGKLILRVIDFSELCY